MIKGQLYKLKECIQFGTINNTISGNDYPFIFKDEIVLCIGSVFQGKTTICKFLYKNKLLSLNTVIESIPGLPFNLEILKRFELLT